MCLTLRVSCHRETDRSCSSKTSPAPSWVTVGTGSVRLRSNRRGDRRRCVECSCPAKSSKNATDYCYDKRWMDWFLVVIIWNLKPGTVTGWQSVAGVASCEAEAGVGADAGLSSMPWMTGPSKRCYPRVISAKRRDHVRNHWTELTRYLDDADLPLYNNQCEQLMRTWQWVENLHLCRKLAWR